MSRKSKKFRVDPGETVDLSDWPTRIDPLFDTKSAYQKQLENHVARLSDLQERLYASHRYGILIIFQAMDGAGKDGCIKHVMSGVNPQGCNVFSFTHPTAVEQRHDFLWRTTRDLPERGLISIYNRSYYEEVLIVRVHPEILTAEAIPRNGDTSGLWPSRYRSILELERHLQSNGTRIVKFFLHISKEEQRKRLLARIDTPDKTWKISMPDVEERRYWGDYKKTYEACLSETSTKHAPWYVIPADDKPTARILVSEVLIDLMDRLDLSLPAPGPERAKELATMRKALEKD